MSQSSRISRTRCTCPDRSPFRHSARRERDYLQAALRSRALHRGYVVPASAPREYRASRRAARRANQESFFVVAGSSGALAGVININNIVRHASLSGQLGYYAFVPHAGNGLIDGFAEPAALRGDVDEGNGFWTHVLVHGALLGSE